MRFVALGVLIAVIVSMSVSQNAGTLRIAGAGKQVVEEILDRSVRDANNDVCAGLVVVSDIDRLSYDANNGVVRLLHSPGRDLLFLQADERVVTILKSGYTPLRVVLIDAGVRLRAGEVWQITITGDKTLERVPVRMVVRPEGSQIIVDDSTRSGGASQELTLGTHLLRIEKDGFEPIDTTITIDPTTTVLRFRLKNLERLPVWISSIPRGAHIAINDSVLGVTDKDVLLYPGRYRLWLATPGYDTLAREIVVLAGTRNEYAFTFGKNSGGLIVHTFPADATVLLDGIERQSDTRIELDAGQHRLTVEKTGYHPQGDFVEIAAGKTIEKSVVLSSRNGILQFSVQPVEATVVMKLNGELYQSWTGDRVIDMLPPGDYVLEISADSYQGAERTVHIMAGEKSIVDVALISTAYGAPLDKTVSDEGEGDLPTAIGASLRVATVIDDYAALGNGIGYDIWLDIALSENWAITLSGFGQKFEGLYDGSYGGGLELSGWMAGLSWKLFHIGPFLVSVQGKFGYAHGKTTEDVPPRTPIQPYLGDCGIFSPSVEAMFNLNGFLFRAHAGQLQLRNKEWWKCTEYQVGIGFAL